MPKNRSVLDVQDSKKHWNESIAGYKTENLVFLDKSGINTYMTRLYGQFMSHERAVDNEPLNTPETTIILSLIRLNEEMLYTTYSGGMTVNVSVTIWKTCFFPL